MSCFNNFVAFSTTPCLNPQRRCQSGTGLQFVSALETRTERLYQTRALRHHDGLSAAVIGPVAVVPWQGRVKELASLEISNWRLLLACVGVCSTRGDALLAGGVRVHTCCIVVKYSLAAPDCY